MPFLWGFKGAKNYANVTAVSLFCSVDKKPIHVTIETARDPLPD
jgi:hypothetical protein